MEQRTSPAPQTAEVRRISHECMIGAHGACYGTVDIYAVNATYLDPPLCKVPCGCTRDECQCREKAARR